jgi:WD40 repeat protein
MATRFYLIFAFSLILPIAGCNSATQPNAASRPAQTTTVASPTNGRASSQESSSEEGVNPKDSNSSLSKGSEAATTTTTSAATAATTTATTTATTATATATATVATVETAATQAKQSAEPSNEQLAAWKQTPYEPHQLLAVRESPKIGLSTSIVGLPDGRRFLLAGNKVSLWAIDGIEPEHVFLDLSYSDKNPIILSMALSPDGKWFAAGDSEGLIHVWNIAERNELISKKIYPTGIVQVAVSPDSSEIATITYSDEVTIWSSDKLEQKKRFKVDTNGVKRIMVINSDSIAVAGETTSSWSVASGKQIQKLSSGRYNFTLARLRDENRILVGDKTGLQIWNVQARKVEDTIAGDFATNELVDFSPDGTLLATANGSSIRLWDMASKQVMQIIDTYGWSIAGIHWLPETNLL